VGGGGGLHINDGFGVAAFIVLAMLIYLYALLNEMIGFGSENFFPGTSILTFHKQ
jgi:hypothetical protein